MSAHVVDHPPGSAVVLAAVAREHMEPDLSVLVLTTLGVTVDDLASEGAGPHDLALGGAGPHDLALLRPGD